MDAQIDFDVNEALKSYLNDPASIPTPEADGALLDCESDPESLTNGLINGVLNPIVDAVANNPDNLGRSSHFHSLQFLLKCAPAFLPSQRSHTDEPDSELFAQSRYSSFINPQILSKIFDLIVSGLAAQAEAIHQELEGEEQEDVRTPKTVLEMYAFLLQWSTSAVEVKAAEKSSNAPAKGRGAGKGAKTKTAGKETTWDLSSQLQTALETMCKVLKLKLGKLFVTTSERDTFVGLFTRPVYLILESEQRTKNTTIRMHAFKVLCIAIKHHGHAFGEMKAFDMMRSYPANAVQALKHLSYRIYPILSIWQNQWRNSYTFWQSSMITLN